MRTVKLGLIGAGGISGAHCRTLAEIEGAELIAAADLVPANLERAKEQWGIKRTFTDYNEMLKIDEIEAVYVCTPTGVHAAPTVAALNAGKHVFCEKPMEATLDAAASMWRAAKENDKILMIGLKLRYSPQVIKAKEIVDAGTLGDIYYVETVADRRRGNPGGSFIRKADSRFRCVCGHRRLRTRHCPLFNGTPEACRSFRYHLQLSEPSQHVESCA